MLNIKIKNCTLGYYFGVFIQLASKMPAVLLDRKEQKCLFLMEKKICLEMLFNYFVQVKNNYLLLWTLFLDKTGKRMYSNYAYFKQLCQSSLCQESN